MTFNNDELKGLRRRLAVLGWIFSRTVSTMKVSDMIFLPSFQWTQWTISSDLIWAHQLPGLGRTGVVSLMWCFSYRVRTMMPSDLLITFVLDWMDLADQLCESGQALLHITSLHDAISDWTLICGYVFVVVYVQVFLARFRCWIRHFPPQRWAPHEEVCIRWLRGAYGVEEAVSLGVFAGFWEIWDVSHLL